MRILSKFKDYYDSALAYGLETDRVYLRETKIFDVSSKEKRNDLIKTMQHIASEALSYHRSSDYSTIGLPAYRHLYIEPLVYCIGGFLYKSLWVYDLYDKNHKPSSLWNRTYPQFYQGMPKLDPNEQRLLQESVNYKLNPGAEIVFSGPVFNVDEALLLLSDWTTSDKDSNFFSRYNKYSKIKGLTEWLEKRPPDIYSLAAQEKIMVAVSLESASVINPRLQDWKFYRFKDATQCIQELSMFLGNMSTPDTVPILLDDKYRIKSHGFDERSFRKQPTKNAEPKRSKRPHPDSSI